MLSTNVKGLGKPVSLALDFVLREERPGSVRASYIVPEE